MAFDFMRIFDDDTFVSPGTIGGKIKRYRELKGLTQKQLGIMCGFGEGSADVRIAQYEKNKKVPREKILNDIAGALGVDVCALYDADILPYNYLYHVLFDIEDYHGLHPVKIGNRLYLEFSGGTEFGDRIVDHDFRDFLTEWQEKRQKYYPNPNDSAEEKEQKHKEYVLWKAEYPQNVARETTERLRNMMKMNRLQAEMDELNAKMMSDSEKERLAKGIEDIMPEVKARYHHITKESEFIYWIKEAMANGFGIEPFSPESLREIDYEFIHLLSIRTNEILGSDDKKRKYAELLCMIDDFREAGINIFESITSKDKELFITFKYLTSQYSMFSNLQKHWCDINYIIERQPWWSKQELDELEEQFREKITGEKDVLFIENNNV